MTEKTPLTKYRKNTRAPHPDMIAVPASKTDEIMIPTRGDEKRDSITNMGTKTHIVFGKYEKRTDNSIQIYTITQNLDSPFSDISGSVTDTGKYFLMQRDTSPPNIKEKTPYWISSAVSLPPTYPTPVRSIA